MALDSSGNAYVTGTTASIDFPTVNPFQGPRGGTILGVDAIVAKLNAAGSALLYSSYLGGPLDDYGYGVAVDSAGNAYVVGATEGFFPRVGPLQLILGGEGAGDAFVAKIYDPPPSVGTNCTYSISPANTSLGSGPERGTVAVTAPTGCNWTATSNRSWIIIIAGSTGNGNGTVTFLLEYSSGSAPRTGTLTIAGQSFTVSQAEFTACKYSISPTSRSHSAGYQAGTVAVSAPDTCLWRPISNVSWVDIVDLPPPRSSQRAGYGTVTYLVSPAVDRVFRTGGIAIGDQTFRVDQAGVGCTYAISPTSRSHGSGPETGTVTVSVATGCTWTASSNAPWITITARSSGSGSEIVSYSVAANPGPSPRTGTLTVAGQTFTITQAGPAAVCTYSISPTSASHGSGAETGTVTVTAAAGCTWTAASNAPWITISSRSSGSGNGTVSYSVAANPAPSPREDTLTIAGRTFTITQAATAEGDAPLFHPLSITNAASFLPGLTPGSIVTIFGEHLSNVEGIVGASGFPLPTELGGTSVTIGDTPAPLFVVANVEGTEQINLQVPWEIQGRTTTRVVVNNNGRIGGVEVAVLPAHPGVFFSQQEGFGAILHGEDYSLVTLAKPARKGEAVVIYATGLGPVSPTPRTGSPAPVDPLSRTSPDNSRFRRHEKPPVL